MMFSSKQSVMNMTCPVKCVGWNRIKHWKKKNLFDIFPPFLAPVFSVMPFLQTNSNSSSTANAAVTIKWSQGHWNWHKQVQLVSQLPSCQVWHVIVPEKIALLQCCTWQLARQPAGWPTDQILVITYSESFCHASQNQLMTRRAAKAEKGERNGVWA